MTTLDAEALVPEPYPTIAAALWQPERRLMIAVLEDAIEAYLANAGATRGIRRTHFEEASRWFQAEDTEWPFSFVNICEACGLEPGVIRRSLLRRVRAELLAVHVPRVASGNGRARPAQRAQAPVPATSWSWRSWVPRFASQTPSAHADLPA
jgi:hypothetical protein